MFLKKWFITLAIIVLFSFSFNSSYSTEQIYSMTISSTPSIINQGEKLEINIELTGKGQFTGLLTIISDEDNLMGDTAYAMFYRIVNSEHILDTVTFGSDSGIGARITLPINATGDENVFRLIYAHVEVETKRDITPLGRHLITASLVGSDSSTNFNYEKDISYTIRTIWETYPWLSRTVSVIIATVLLFFLRLAWKYVKKRILRPELEIEYNKEDKNYLGFYTHYQFDIHRKHARVYVWNNGRSDAINVRAILEVETPISFLQPANLHWAINPYVSPDPEPVNIPRKNFQILDLVFSQLENGTELCADLVSQSIYGPPEKQIFSTPPSATVPPGMVSLHVILDSDKDRLREQYAGMYHARLNGCYRCHNMGLLFPREAEQHYFPPGEYNIKITLNGDNFDEINKSFILISPDFWRDLDLTEP